MSEAIFPQQFVAHFDDEGIELVVVTPGPAGAVDIDLRDGVSLMIDFANPGSVNSVRVHGDEIPDVLVDLIGEDRVEQLADVDRSSKLKPVRLQGQSESDRDTPPRFRGSRPQQPQQTAEELGVLSRLQSLADDDELHDIVRATSGLEFIERSERLRGEMPDLVGPLRRFTAIAADLLDGEELNLAQLSRRDHKAASQLAGLCRPFQSDFESLGRAYEFLMNQPIELGWQSQDLDVASANHMASRDEGFDFEAPVRVSAVTLTDGGLLTARITMFEEDWWLRVTLEGTQVLLAVVPVLGHADRAIAEALVPTDVMLKELDLQLIRTPLPSSHSTIDQVMAAINLGRAAVRRSLVRRTEQSFRLWMQCADAWLLLGDEQRATQARRYAQRGLPSVGPRLVTLEVLAVFESVS